MDHCFRATVPEWRTYSPWLAFASFSQACSYEPGSKAGLAVSTFVQGEIYGWRLDASSGVWIPTITLRAPVSIPPVTGFGTALALSDTFIVAGAPAVSGNLVRR